MLKSASGKQMFGDIVRRKRYFYALLMILLMIGAAELLMEREIIFPEMAALTIGMWIVDKRVWQVSRASMVVLMILGAVAGVYSTLFSFPLACESGVCLYFCRSLPHVISCNFGTADFCLYVTCVIGHGKLGLSGSCTCYVGYCCCWTMGDGESWITGEGDLYSRDCPLEG